MRLAAIALGWLSFLACATAKAPSGGAGAPKPAELVATTTTFQVTDAELDKYIADRPKLARQVYDLRRSALEELALDRLIDLKAGAGKVSPDDWLRKQVEEQVPVPSDSEIRVFYETRLGGDKGQYKYETVAPQIRDQLLGERREEVLHSVLDKLRSEAKLTILLPAPRVQIAGEGPSMGPAAAPVTIVEFSDYQCPYCQRQEEALKQILKDYPTQVRLVVRDFPLSMHPDARRAARAAVCANAQGRFWQMHDRMFEDQGALADEDLERDAHDLGLDGKKFTACLKAKETDAQVAESQRDGEDVGVDGTPALFVNGRPFSGAASYKDIKEVVEEELHGELQKSPKGGAVSKSAGSPN